MLSPESLIGPSHVTSQNFLFSGLVSQEARPWSALIILHEAVLEYSAPLRQLMNNYVNVPTLQ
jgi:hypothetical protein